MISHDLDKGTMVNHDLARLTMILASVECLRLLGKAFIALEQPFFVLNIEEYFFRFSLSEL